MNNTTIAKALRNIALLLILYVIGTFFGGLSSESEIGVWLGKIGLAILTVSTALEMVSIFPVRRETNAYESAFTMMAFSAVIAIVSVVFSGIAGNSKFAIYAGNLAEYLSLLGGIASAGMILLGTMQLLRKKKEKELADKAMKVVQNYIILTAAAIVMKILSAMLGTPENMEPTILAAFAYGVLNVIAYVKYISFLFKAAKVLK